MIELPMKPVLVLAALFVLATAACSKSAPPEGALTNDLRLPGAPVGKAGIPDDSIKPLPTPVVGRGGVPDDGVKPVGVPPVPPAIKR